MCSKFTLLGVGYILGTSIMILSIKLKVHLEEIEKKSNKESLLTANFYVQ